MGFAYDETAAQTTVLFRFPPVPFRFPARSLHADHNGIRSSRGVDHGQPREARPGRVDQALPPAVDVPG